MMSQRTRFIFRWRARVAPWWVAAACWASIVPADFVMSRDMLRAVRSRAGRANDASPEVSQVRRAHRTGHPAVAVNRKP
jgi:hypothetical protein